MSTPDPCPPSEASSPASAGSTSASSAPGGPDAGRWSGTPSASTSSPTTGPMFPDMETSPVSTGLWPTPTAQTGGDGQRPDGFRRLLAQEVVRRASSPSISLQGASPASRSAWPGSSGARTTSGGSGPSSPVSLASYDPATSSWRTSQGSWLDMEAWGTSLATWPPSGMTRNGTAFLLPPSVPRTSVTGSGSWPTPTMSDGMGGPGSSGRDGGDNLRTAVSQFPTPTATMHKGSSPKSMTRISGKSRLNDRLDFAVEQGIGQLNPTWVEWLMGFPLGWTDCEHLATPSFRKSLKSSDAG